MRSKKFTNIDPIKHHTSLNQFKRWRQERIRKLRSKDYSYNVPMVQPDLSYIKQNEQSPTITWIGHSTFFIQLAGLNIVTDPVWASQMALRKRMTAPGIAIDRVPPIDVVLISHSHYDHLNIPSLRKLQGDKLLLVPAGLSAKLKGRGFTNVHELYWWESYTVGEVTFTFVPAQHWTRRNPWDTNSSHWGGWLIAPADKEQTSQQSDNQHSDKQIKSNLVDGNEVDTDVDTVTDVDTDVVTDTDIDLDIDRDRDVNGKNSSVKKEQATISSASLAGEVCTEMTASVSCFFEQHEAKRPELTEQPVIYFAGDSGYFAGFKEIGYRFDIDIALLPIGAYEPEWFMGPQHITPEEALQAFLDTKAKHFVPMHYGSFKLADDTPREALERLFNEMNRLVIDPASLILLPHGETWRITNE
ncbi:MBL fold metallo-hydrolase [Paenibacillus yanchengensis]|uniref:MBL fold metallo-hydrolase n=1 Tax=Paenibacillus yanchengensis TaxID=2035833 RepID=A0ABW4YI94_9BACL